MTKRDLWIRNTKVKFICANLANPEFDLNMHGLAQYSDSVGTAEYAFLDNCELLAAIIYDDELTYCGCEDEDD